MLCVGNTHINTLDSIKITFNVLGVENNFDGLN